MAGAHVAAQLLVNFVVGQLLRHVAVRVRRLRVLLAVPAHVRQIIAYRGAPRQQAPQAGALQLQNAPGLPVQTVRGAGREAAPLAAGIALHPAAAATLRPCQCRTAPRRAGLLPVCSLLLPHRALIYLHTCGRAPRQAPGCSTTADTLSVLLIKQAAPFKRLSPPLLTTSFSGSDRTRLLRFLRGPRAALHACMGQHRETHTAREETRDGSKWNRDGATERPSGGA